MGELDQVVRSDVKSYYKYDFIRIDKCIGDVGFWSSVIVTCIYGILKSGAFFAVEPFNIIIVVLFAATAEPYHFSALFGSPKKSYFFLR